ncbi:MAG: RNA-binding protein [Beijerinckiaceae bacterium]|nr:RNA-binding protein [Beijerinckiaceae bacterium]
MARVKDDEEGPERTCIVTRRKSDPDHMLRFVLAPDLSVVPDIRRKLPGRGVWILAHAGLVAEAVKKQAFARGFKTKVAASPTLAAETEDLLTRDCIQALSMANKAGIVVAGFAKVEAAIASGKTGAILHAVEAGEDGIRKIEGALRRQVDQAVHPDVIKLFPSLQLDLALGRTNVIHAALAGGPACKAFLARCQRLMLYRSEVPSSADA